MQSRSPSSGDEYVDDAVLVSFFQGYDPKCEMVMDGLAECAGYARLVDMIRDFQIASGFQSFKDLIEILDKSQAWLIIPAAQKNDLAWEQIVSQFWSMLMDKRNNRHNLSESELLLIFQSVQKNRMRFLQCLYWLATAMQCRPGNKL